mgnify:FL=1
MAGVEDDGVGIPSERIEQVLQPGYGTGLGMGLSNVNERLRSIYGSEYGLRIESREGQGTRVLVRVPRRGREMRSEREEGAHGLARPDRR